VWARFEVVEMSMAPALLPGDYLLTRRGGRSVKAGDLVVFEHTLRPGFFLVKRVVRIESDTAYVLGDDLERSTADSRQLGPIPIASLRRVVFRYWPLGRLGPIP
jgi:hypothetical protein